MKFSEKIIMDINNMVISFGCDVWNCIVILFLLVINYFYIVI